MGNEIPQEDLIQWAWLAGLIDGDGCISIDRGKKRSYGYYPTPKVRIVLSDTCLFVLEKIQALAGGTISFRNIEKSSLAQLQNTRNQYEWCITGKKAAGFVDTVYPFLVLKKETANKFKEVYSLVENGLYKTNFEEFESKRKSINNGRKGRKG